MDAIATWNDLELDNEVLIDQIIDVQGEEGYQKLRTNVINKLPGVDSYADADTIFHKELTNLL